MHQPSDYVQYIETPTKLPAAFFVDRFFHITEAAKNSKTSHPLPVLVHSVESLFETCYLHSLAGTSIQEAPQATKSLGREAAAP